MKKKLLGLMLSIFILVPTFASAKMLKTPEGTWVNENVIYEIAPLKNGCKIYYSVGSGSRNYSVPVLCEEYIKNMDIEVKE